MDVRLGRTRLLGLIALLFGSASLADDTPLILLDRQGIAPGGRLAFTADGSRLVATWDGSSGQTGGTVIWSVAKRKRILGVSVGALKMSKNAEVLITAGGEILKGKSGRPSKSLTGARGGNLAHLELSDNGRLMAALFRPRNVQSLDTNRNNVKSSMELVVFDTTTKKEKSVFDSNIDLAPTASASSLAFSPDGTLLGVASLKECLYFDLSSGEEIARIPNPRQTNVRGQPTVPLQGGVPRNNSAKNLFERRDRLWADFVAAHAGSSLGGIDLFCPLEWNPETKTLVVTARGGAYDWNVETATMTTLVEPPSVESHLPEPLTGLLFPSADGSMVAYTHQANDVNDWERLGLVRGEVGIIDAAEDRKLATIPVEGDLVTAMAFSPDLKWLALGYAGGMVKLLDLARLTEVEAAGGDLVAKIIDNPEFESWADYSPGSTVTYSLKIGARGKSWMEGIEVSLRTREKDELQVGSVQFRDDALTQKRYTNPADLASVFSETSADRPYRSKDFRGTVKIIGRQTISAAGREYPCTVYQLNGRGERGIRFTEKKWISHEVPGLLVKSDKAMEGCSTPVTHQALLVSISKESIRATIPSGREAVR